MNLRESSLPPGWYPRSAGEIERFLADFCGQEGHARAAIAPHAGWFYSGRIAARAVSGLDRQAETVVVLGGHLPAGAAPLFALEDGVRTPLGPMAIDTELRELVLKKLGGREDQSRDNTIEVLLPMVRFFFPQAMLLWIRLPAELSAFEAGRAVARAAELLGRRVVALGSTDLTHYGADYGFSPKGGGQAALRWVREVNDAAFIRVVEAGGPAAVLDRAEEDRSSCSAGAVLGTLGFAGVTGAPLPRLLEYATSADALAAEREGRLDSFVGYAAFIFG
ncbi:MAG: AmmeMemoRadiSam system protein B [Treponema sp.]|jgi:AmmeMemoRadiSam system protein B|nr:AmmeMemoRadiSam system protein B [Treponema sp.]